MNKILTKTENICIYTFPMQKIIGIYFYRNDDEFDAHVFLAQKTFHTIGIYAYYVSLSSAESEKAAENF